MATFEFVTLFVIDAEYVIRCSQEQLSVDKHGRGIGILFENVRGDEFRLFAELEDERGSILTRRVQHAVRDDRRRAVWVAVPREPLLPDLLPGCYVKAFDIAAVAADIYLGVMRNG